MVVGAVVGEGHRPLVGARRPSLRLARAGFGKARPRCCDPGDSKARPHRHNLGDGEVSPRRIRSLLGEARITEPRLGAGDPRRPLRPPPPALPGGGRLAATVARAPSPLLQTFFNYYYFSKN
ncbi:hypothetical protein NL676_021137 [Syzygium grande]|nr:hypothetical protein NL676_021137 [Syzygium grande]